MFEHKILSQRTTFDYFWQWWFLLMIYLCYICVYRSKNTLNGIRRQFRMMLFTWLCTNFGCDTISSNTSSVENTKCKLFFCTKSEINKLENANLWFLQILLILINSHCPLYVYVVKCQQLLVVCFCHLCYSCKFYPCKIISVKFISQIFLALYSLCYMCCCLTS